MGAARFNVRIAEPDQTTLLDSRPLPQLQHISPALALQGNSIHYSPTVLLSYRLVQVLTQGQGTTLASDYITNHEPIPYSTQPRQQQEAR